MKLLAVTNMYPTKAFPGKGVFVEEQIRGLRAIGLDVTVLFIDRWREGPLTYYGVGDRVARSLKQCKADLVHAMYGGVMAQQIAKADLSVPLVITFHGSDLLGENLSGLPRKLISRYGVWCSRKAALAAEGLIVVARHLLSALPPAARNGKVRVLPCGIDLDRFKPEDSLLCRRRLGWSDNALHVLFASSNGDPVKRPWLAQAAVDKANRRGLRAELHYMTGVPNADVPTWLSASDVLMLTSLHEGSPTIVKEALACSLPVVSVDVGDVAERIEGMDGCYLATPDEADLADKLALVQKRGSRLNCGSRLGELSSVAVAQKLKDFYTRILRT